MTRTATLLLVISCLILAFVPLVAIGLAIWLRDGAPVLYHQTRIGRQMRPFKLYKFRSMDCSPANGRSLTVGDDPRITRTGRWLRKYRLDELPQLLNILLGDMAFIGPRPEIPEFVNTDDPLEWQVAAVRPGLFDSATIRYRHMAEILARQDDWRTHYRTVIRPDKLEHSLNDIRQQSLKHQLRLAMQVLRLILKQD